MNAVFSPKLSYPLFVPSAARTRASSSSALSAAQTRVRKKEERLLSESSCSESGARRAAVAVAVAVAAAQRACLWNDGVVVVIRLDPSSTSRQRWRCSIVRSALMQVESEEDCRVEDTPDQEVSIHTGDNNGVAVPNH